MKPIAALLIGTLCISCDRPESESHDPDNTHLLETEAQQSASEEANVQRENALQQQSFFKEFSIALTEDKAEAAAAMIAQEHRERFQSGYRLWRGARFFDPIVKRVSGDQTLIEVEVSIKHEQRGEDRETTSLRFIDGKWQLLDS